MAKLWAKGYELDLLIEDFTVGNDYILDRELIVADCAGGIAQARMLESIGVLQPEECAQLVSALSRYAAEGAEGKFEIDRGDEDCHTAIENRLTSDLGEAGKKIHTGRSRNDQVLTALRLVERSFLVSFGKALCSLVRTMFEISNLHRLTPMPGRTHFQTAMPSSVGLWIGAIGEQLVDQLIMSEAVYGLVDRCPLGSAAGYGVPLAIDREKTAELLGFGRVHNNVIAVANSRGEIEGWILSLIDHVGLVLSRFAEDLILFSLPEIGYFSLPPELCSGSSIMPQKKNPDVLELMRGKSATLSSYAQQIGSVIRSMPTGYNRDLQETKEPLLRGMRGGLQLVRIAEHTAKKLEVNRDRLEAGLTPEIYATDVALEGVLSGMSFRDAYKKVAGGLDAVETRDSVESLKARNHVGTAVRIGSDGNARTIEEISARYEDRGERIRLATGELFGKDFPIYFERSLT